jgi:hypothetical protein
MTESLGPGAVEPSLPAGWQAGAPAYSYPSVPTGPRNGLGVASLVIGVAAVVAIVSIIGGLALGIVAAGMGQAARKRAKRGEATNGGVALAGVTLGLIATAVSVALGLSMAGLFIWGITTDQFNSEYQHCIGEHPGHEQDCDQYR